MLEGNLLQEAAALLCKMFPEIIDRDRVVELPSAASVAAFAGGPLR